MIGQEQRAVREQSALLDTIFARAPIGLAFYDRELRFVRINDTLAEINGLAPEDHIGRTVPEVLPQLGDRILGLFRQVLDTGEPVIGVEITGETPAAPGIERNWEASYYPVSDPEGRILGIGAVVQETTERVRLRAAEQVARERAETAERRWSFLAEAGELLASSLDYEVTLERLADVVVPAKSDAFAVDLLSADGTIKRMAVAHVDPAKAELGWELARRFPSRLDDPVGPGAVIRTGEAELYTELEDEVIQAVANEREHLELLRSLDFRSAMVVPLKLHGRTLGALTLLASESGRRFGEDNLQVASELARRAAAAVENARLYRERSHIARVLQSSLLPPHLPSVPGFQVAARYRPAGSGSEVGGDFYDLFERSSERWAAVIGDVCGKGPGAASLAALARHTLRAGAIRESSPSSVLALLNEAILRERDDDRFCTVAYATLHTDGDAARTVVACGGHPLPLLLRAGGRVEQVGAPGTLLGVHAEPVLEDCQLELAPGDALILYTDGVADAPARAGVLAPGQLAEIAAAATGLDAEEIAARIEAPLLAMGGGESRDDAALLVLRRER